MRNDPLPFALASDGAADGTSAPLVIRAYWGHVVQIGGAFSATVTIKGRLDPSMDYALLDQTTAPKLVPVHHPMHDLVIEVSDHASGQVSAMYAGYKIR